MVAFLNIFRFQQQMVAYLNIFRFNTFLIRKFLIFQMDCTDWSGDSMSSKIQSINKNIFLINFTFQKLLKIIMLVYNTYDSWMFFFLLYLIICIFLVFSFQSKHGLSTNNFTYFSTKAISKIVWCQSNILPSLLRYFGTSYWQSWQGPKWQLRRLIVDRPADVLAVIR